MDYLRFAWHAFMYIDGFCASDTGSFSRARKKRFGKEVQFILWHPEEHGHTKPYWVAFNSVWWHNFVSLDDYVSMEELIRKRDENSKRSISET